MAPTPFPQLLDVSGVADYLGITQRMARRLFDDRAYPVVKVGRRVYVKRTDLDDYIQQQTEPAAAEGGGTR